MSAVAAEVKESLKRKRPVPRHARTPAPQAGFRGHIDLINGASMVEGWAVDEARPLMPVRVRVQTEEGVILADGEANLYREDLMKAGIGVGFSAFKLRIESAHPRRLCHRPLLLIDAATDTLIVRADRVSYSDHVTAPFASVAELLAGDPTVLGSIAQLAGCEAVFERHIQRYGIGGFVRASYIYVLGRTADAGGLAHYASMLRRHELTPFGLLQLLADSDEFRSRSRQLAPPNSGAFPFSA